MWLLHLPKDKGQRLKTVSLVYFMFGNTSLKYMPDMLYLLICDVCCQLKLQQRQRLKGEEGAYKSVTACVANVTLQDMLRLQSTCAARCNGTQASTCPVYCQQLDNAAGIHSSIYAHMLFWKVRYIQCRVVPCLRGSRGATDRQMHNQIKVAYSGQNSKALRSSLQVLLTMQLTCMLTGGLLEPQR